MGGKGREMATLVHRAMVWLGITDDEEELEMPIYRNEAPRAERPERSYEEERYEEPPSYSRSERAASRVQVVQGIEGAAEQREEFLPPRVNAPSRPERVEPEKDQRTQVIRSIKPEGPKVHLAIPTRFSDVQDIADHMKGGRPVIVNIEGLDKEVYRRIIDFCSGLTYALGGKIRKVGEQVYLLTPSKVEVADEEMERIAERAVFRGN